MNPVLLEKAKLKINSVPLLVNMISRRVRQLNAGMRPYLKPLTPTEERVDIALREVIDGKLTAEIGFFEPVSPGSHAKD
ncbi:MAG: DNA-directed RNA polymerase subunit omega [bacterium]